MSKLQLLRPAGKQPAAAQPQPERPQVPLLETDPAKGLTAEQAAQRMAALDAERYLDGLADACK